MNLDNLDKIQRLEAPPFLYTRIKQKIEQSKEARVHPVLVMAAASVVVILFAINTFVLFDFTSQPSSIQNLSDSINLISNNSLYE